VQDTIIVQNSAEVVSLLEKYTVKLGLQSHTHINERVNWKGIDFTTTGAVSGNWWKGPRLGFPEGYAVLDNDWQLSQRAGRQDIGLQMWR
jgi:Icc protein